MVGGRKRGWVGVRERGEEEGQRVGARSRGEEGGRV